MKKVIIRTIKDSDGRAYTLSSLGDNTTEKIQAMIAGLNYARDTGTWRPFIINYEVPIKKPVRGTNKKK